MRAARPMPARGLISWFPPTLGDDLSFFIQPIRDAAHATSRSTVTFKRAQVTVGEIVTCGCTFWPLEARLGILSNLRPDVVASALAAVGGYLQARSKARGTDYQYCISRHPTRKELTSTP